MAEFFGQILVKKELCCYHISMITKRTTPGGISYLLERKRMKNTYLRIRNGEVHMSADQRLTLKEVDRIVDVHRDWIIKNLNKPQHQPKDPNLCYLLGKPYRIERLDAAKNEVRFSGEVMQLLLKEDADPQSLIESFQRKLAKTVFLESVRRQLPLLARYRIPMPEVAVRKMKTMWGNCAFKKGKVTFALMLIEQPMEAIDYIVLHELVHFVHPDHGSGFYGLVRELMPDYKEREKRLQVHGL